MAMSFPFIDGQAQQFPGQSTFNVGASDYATLLSTANPNATSMDGGAWIMYLALMGGDIRRAVAIYPSTNVPVDPGLAEGS